MGFRYLVSLLSAIQAMGLLAFTPAGLTPAEHASLRWTHNRACDFLAHGFPIIFFQRLSQSESKELWLESYIIPTPRRETSPFDTTYALLDVSAAGRCALGGWGRTKSTN